MNRWARLVSAVAAATLLLVAGPAAGQLTPDERKCIDQVTAVAIAVSKTQNDENRNCVKNAGKGKEDDPEACLAADAKGKVARAEQRVADTFRARCARGAPLVTDPEATNAAHREEAINLVHDLFGADLTASAATINPGQGQASCQDTVIQRARTLWDITMKTFLQCVGDGLKAGAHVPGVGRSGRARGRARRVPRLSGPRPGPRSGPRL